MSTPKWISPFFVLSGLYDGILGLIFTVFPYQLFKLANVTLPNHIGYIQFPGLLLVIFGIMFLNIARDPKANKNLIPYGILLKLSYCSIVFFYWAQHNIPFMWVPFAFFDFAFMIAFVISYKVISD